MKFDYYFNKLIRIIKEILDDPDLTAEEKVKLLEIFYEESK